MGKVGSDMMTMTETIDFSAHLMQASLIRELSIAATKRFTDVDNHHLIFALTDLVGMSERQS